MTGCPISPEDLEGIEACEDCDQPCADLWTLSDGWGDRKDVCWACANEAGNYGWRAQ